MSKFNKSNIIVINFDEIHTDDYPDFCDGYVSKALYNGNEMTQDELDELNEDRELIGELIMEYFN
jgi:hypothetical protein